MAFLTLHEMLPLAFDHVGRMPKDWVFQFNNYEISKSFNQFRLQLKMRLFHVVVENDDKSTEIIKHLNQQKGGRLTFIPLNRINAPRVTYPEFRCHTSLLKKLNFKHDYTPAFSQEKSCSESG